MNTLTCLPDEPREINEVVMAKIDEMGLPLVEDLFVMPFAEGATVLACPLNLSLFGMTAKDLVDGVKPADPAKYYKEVVIPADMNLTF
jgi:peroxiredoxin family protein